MWTGVMNGQLCTLFQAKRSLGRMEWSRFISKQNWGKEALREPIYFLIKKQDQQEDGKLI